MSKKDNKYNDSITRSNALIESRYSASLLENKLMVWSLKTASLDQYNRLVARTNTSEIIKMTGSKKGGGIYKSLRKVAANMADRTLFFEDEENQRFTFLNVIHKVTYEAGVFEVVFTPEINEHLIDLRSNFTVMQLSLLEKFTSNHAFRLYEILKVHYYRIPADNTPVIITYDLSDLKFQLNCVDTQSAKVKEELRKEHPDFDQILQMPGVEKKYRTWYEFKRNVLIPAKAEINELSDLYIDFRDIRGGRGGKIKKVEFLIQRNVKQDHIEYPQDIIDAAETEEMTRASLVPKVRDIFKDVKNISDKDCLSILKAADNDLDRITKAYALSQKQPHISNFVGWILTCIKEDYEDVIEVVEGSAEKAEAVNTIRENIESQKAAISEKAWAQLKDRLEKNKEQYDEFSSYIESSTGFDFLIYDMVTEADQKVQDFTTWFKQR